MRFPLEEGQKWSTAYKTPRCWRAIPTKNGPLKLKVEMLPADPYLKLLAEIATNGSMTEC